MPPNAKLLLGIHLPSLQTSSMSIHVGLPSRRTEILETAWCAIIKDLLNLLERLLAGFGEEEEDVEEHGYAEYTEYNVDFPADVGKCRGDEVGQCKVEGP